ncbi:fasciclin domain-containing protein [Rhizophagus clarus]|uniref:Fasciclin domain-containing protein n=1 Tax=Rhizophagus clarus TaxID=94130 RepID=A0A8H3QGS1_9GLOM|nr:fasciclin domain-containing protein [Rhizophagus clarus]
MSIIIFFIQILLITTIIAQDVKKNLYSNIVSDGPQLLALGAILNNIPKFVATLKSAGPYTFFAPDNNALESISATPDEIEQMLNHHLIPGKFLSNDFPSISYPKSMLMVAPITGAKWAIAGTAQPIVVEKLPAGGMEIMSGWKSANVLALDQVASNGVIHIVDTILDPPMTPMQTLLQSNDFESMTLILEDENYGKLADEIAKVNDAGVTILALTNDVIVNNIPKEITNNLNLVNPIFSYHIIPNEIIYSGSVENVLTAKTLKNEILTFTRDNGELYVGNANTKAKIVQADIITYNGVLHVIDNVLIPPSIQITPKDNPVTVPVPPPTIPSDIPAVQTQPFSSPSASPSPAVVPVENASSNAGTIVAYTIGGVVGGGLIMLGGFFLIYRMYIKKAKTQQELLPYFLGHNMNSQPSRHSHTNSNDNYSIPTTNQEIRSLSYVGSDS